MARNAATGPESRWREWSLFGLLVGAVVAFGVLVEIRSAFLSRRMGDVGCYFRGAWAVRTGGDPYAVTCDNGWHYNYPPFLAIVLTPLADPPRGFDDAGMTPFPVSVAIWYLLSVLCLALAVHWLAGALEDAAARRTGQAVEAWSRRWLALRIWPVLIGAAPIGGTLGRGQVNLVVLLMLCAAIAAWIRGRGFAAGLWLSVAIAIKVIPAFLLIYPIWRRDVKALAGCGLGLLATFIALPVVAFGPDKTVDHYRHWLGSVVVGSFSGQDDARLAGELLPIDSTDTQSFQAIWHRTVHPNPPRPPYASRLLVLAHWGLGGALTVVTLLAARRTAAADKETIALTVGGLCVIMCLLSPVCHLHYFALALPLILGLVHRHLERNGVRYWNARLSPVVILFVAGMIVPHIPGWQMPRDLGAASYAALLVWTAGVAPAWRRRKEYPDTAGLELMRLAA